MRLNVMSKVVSLMLICMMISFVSCSSVKQPKTKITKVNKYKFNFESDPVFTNILAKAEKEQKLVFVDMSAKWCVPCQLMKRDVYTDNGTADFFNKNFINYLVDAEVGEGPDLKVIFGVEEFPTLLIVNEKGRVVSRRVGGTYQRDLVDFGQQALDM